MPHPPRDRQARQGFPGPSPPTAPRCHGVEGAPGAQRVRHGRGRRRRLGHQFSGRRAVWRHRPHVGPCGRLRHQGQWRHARSVLWLGHHLSQHRRCVGQVRAGRSGDLGWHRDDVASEEGPPPHGRRQPGTRRASSAGPPGGVRRRDRHDGRHLPRGARLARSAHPEPRRNRDQRRAASTRA